jgi:hypothetical protein
MKIKKVNEMRTSNLDIIESQKKLANFAKKLFIDKYQDNMSDDSYDICDDFNDEVQKKAEELGMDINLLEQDGECFGFDNYDMETKSIWISYGDGEPILFYEWI